MKFTAEIIRAIAPRAKASLVDPLAEALNVHLAAGGISDLAEVRQFMAQAAHESAGFTTMMELWGPTEAQRRYEGRKDLGNVQPGDGFRFRGRGIFQLTGRANYRTIGAALGLPLEINPDLAAVPANAVRIAAYYWRTRGIGPIARRGDLEGVTRRINGGLNGLDARRRLLDRCIKFIGPQVVA